MRKVRQRSFLFLFFHVIVSGAFAQKYYVSSGSELQKLQLKPGDTVMLKEGVWTDEHLDIKGKGTQSRPIVIMSAQPGKVKLTGRSTLRIAGAWIVVDGLYFVDGNPEKEDVIDFSDSASWCRLTNTAIVNYNSPDRKTSNRFVSMHGTQNRVDHCFFKGKTNHGPTLVVWLSDKPNYHRIDHNHFGARPPLGENGGETIRIGTSTWSLYNSYTIVEYNLFDHCDGELEIISNKSCHNTLRYNTFFESQGTLTLRHGNNAVVYGNFFIGNNIKNTGGIRIIGEDHVVFDNYFEGLKGKGVSAAINMVNGIRHSPLTGYYQVKNAHVVNNTIVRCEESFSLGTGKNTDRSLPPVNCTILANHIIPGSTLITYHDVPIGLDIKNNLVYEENRREAEPGFRIVDPESFRDVLPAAEKNNGRKPPLVDKTIGISWRSNAL
jgi:poly(beta-D-mannuronate) lyase